jgi:hypothetical protein
MKRISLITTTINVPTFLEGILKNYKKNSKNFELEILVIGDRKTPKSINSYIEKLKKKYLKNISYFDIKSQDNFFNRKYKKIYKLFPYNDALRKLLGSIYILDRKEKKIDKVIFIDDDNYVNNNINFLKDFDIVGSFYSGNLVSNKKGWPNLYKSFIEKQNIPIFPRGFPWSYRNQDSLIFDSKKGKKQRVVANCGYILGDPDIDAVSRLFNKIETIGVKNKNYYVLAKNNYFPLNDQNLCISKDYLSLYYKPIAAGRNSDIWTSYLISKVAAYHNELISYGRPHLNQIRNIHDFWNDYELEKDHNIATDFFVEILNSIKLSKKDTRINNYIKLCIDAMKRCDFKVKKINQKKLNLLSKSTRHYQNISAEKKIKRDIFSIHYIKKYFKEYLNWLRLIKYYKLDNY